MSRIVPSQVVSFIDEVIKPFLESSASREIRLHPETIGHIAALIELLDRVPGELITLEGPEFARFVWGTAALKMAVKTFEPAQPAHTSPLRGGSAFGGLHPVDAVRQGLQQCPDEFPAPSTAELLVVPDQELRESLRLDISSTNAALSYGQWKAATVLAGSIVEALLLWKLRQDTTLSIQTAQKLVQQNRLSKDPGPNLERWHLPDYIEVAATLNFITANTAQSCRLTKDFRNLIHPGREQRLEQGCDRGTALNAAAAIEHVIRDVQK